MSTKNGFYDKLSSVQNESLSARLSILNTMKSTYGPRILSSLFVSVLNQRQEHGVVSSASTFKPPPRVTLTDAKREAWLRDLANPSIPLRRLSRTIPHGIRGKILLDHCLSKQIPTSRAIWLVKCVGANEIRAFKRKGTGGAFTVGGEAKWVQDWTVNVQQFLQGLIAECGGPEWKRRISYGLRLTAHIYTDHLLDRGFYLTWLVQSFEECNLDTLPIWLLLLNIHRAEILRSRQHGRRMADALLTHLGNTLRPAWETAYQSLQTTLIAEIRSLMENSVECFISPQHWVKRESLVRLHVIEGSQDLERRYKLIAERNRVLLSPTVLREEELRSSAQRSIIKALDSIVDGSDYAAIASSCLESTNCHQTLVDTCLQWTSSMQRSGLSRPYSGARILRLWHEQGIRLQDHICAFLATSQETQELDQTAVYQLVAELVRSGHFSAGKYCQWLLARGTFNKTSPFPRPETRFLYEMPLVDMPAHVQNFRRSLLRSLGSSLADEQSIIQKHKTLLARKLGIPYPEAGALDESINTYDITELSSCRITVKYEIARWLRTTLIHGMYNRKGPKDARKTTSNENLRPLSLEQFNILRTIFEQIQVFPVYADILLDYGRASDSTLLKAIIDTANYYFSTFDALDCMTSLFDVVNERMSALPTLKEVDRSLIQGLFDLAVRLPSRRQEAHKIRKDLRAYDLKQAAAAPSPISDTMIETMDSSNPTFVDEMEQMLTAGASIDEATLARIFQRISRQFELSVDDCDRSYDRLAELLGRLRGFNTVLFDSIMSRWIESIFSWDYRPGLFIIFVPLICLDVVSLKTVLLRSLSLMSVLDPLKAAEVALTTLRLLASLQESHMPPGKVRCHQFLYQRQISLQRNTDDIVKIVLHCIRVSSDDSNKLCQEAKKILESDKCTSFVRMLISQITIDKSQLSQMAPAMQIDVRDLLRYRYTHLTGLDGEKQILSLLNNVNYLNLTLYQLLITDLPGAAGERDEQWFTTLAEVMVNRASKASNSQLDVWSLLLSEVPVNDVLTVHKRVQQEIMGILEVTKVSEFPEAPEVSDDQQLSTVLENLLRLVSKSATTDLSSDPHASLWIQQLSTILTDIVSQRAVMVQTAASDESSMSMSSSQAEQQGDGDGDGELLIHKISVTVRLLIAYQAVLQNPRFSQDHLSQLCITLTRLHGQLARTLYATVTQYTLDLLILLSDSLSDTSRSRCFRTCVDSNNASTSPSNTITDPLSSSSSSLSHSTQIIPYLFNTNDALTTTPTTTSGSSNTKWLQLSSNLPAPPSSFSSSSLDAAAALTPTSTSVATPAPPTPAAVNTLDPLSANLSIAGGGEKGGVGYRMNVGLFDFRKWEMVQDATPSSSALASGAHASENDTSLSLTLFGARRSVL